MQQNPYLEVLIFMTFICGVLSLGAALLSEYFIAVVVAYFIGVFIRKYIFKK